MSYSLAEIQAALQAAGTQQSSSTLEGTVSPERFRAVNDRPHLSALLAEIRTDAWNAHATRMPELPFSLFRLFEADGTRREYETPYFARRRRLLALALASLIDDTNDHLIVLQDTLWAICDEYSWELPAHLDHHHATPAGRGRQSPAQGVDLFAAETCHALGETVTLLAGRLHPWIVQRVHAEIERRIFEPLFDDPLLIYWESSSNNWAAVCGGAIGMSALLVEQNTKRLSGMLERCMKALESFLTGYGADGACAEGIDYWQYGFGYYVYFAEMLHEHTQGRLDLLAGDKIRRMAAYPAHISLDRGHFVNFSDGKAESVLHPGLISRLAGRLQMPVPYLARVPGLGRENRWPHVTRDLLWTDPTLFHRPAAAATAYFPNVHWVVERTEIDEASIAFSAKGGHNAEPHNHNDLGHFIVQAGGESLLADLGPGLYTRDYFGTRRYESIFTRSLGHSVPLIDGHEQQAGSQFRATVQRYDFKPDGLVFALDLTRAYDVAGLRRYVRTFRWSRRAHQCGAELELTDGFAFGTAPDMLEEVFISLHQPTLSPGSICWAGARSSVTLRYDAQQFNARCEDIPSRTRDDDPIVVHRLRLSAREPRADETCQFTFTILDHEALEKMTG